MDAVFAVIASILIVALFTVLFCLIGRTVLDGTGVKEGSHYYVVAASYFIGMAVYLSVLRTLTLVIRSYRIAFWILLILSGIFAAINIYRRYIPWFYKNKGLLAGMACLWIVETLHALVYRLSDVNSAELSTNSSIGTIGSLRYAGIADYFVEQNHIPVLNQSYGQSVLASFSRMLGRNNLCFALTLWLALSGAFLCLLLYGIFRRYFSVCLSVLLVCVVYMGSVSLTLAPIRVVDSDYPLLSSGYTDSVVGVVTLFLYLEIVIKILRNNSKLTFFHYFVTACCVLYWAMSAPHNIVILLGTGALFIVYLLIKKENKTAVRGIIIGGVILASFLLGILEGGMLTPSGLVEQVSIEGVMNVTGPDGTHSNEGIAIVPVMNYQLSKEPGVLWGLGQNIPYTKETLECAVDALHHGQWYVLLYALTALWWDSIRVIFWPLLGVLGMGLAAYRQGNNREKSLWALAGLGTLGVGYPIACFISLNAYKWALSRFAMPFYFLGMIFLAVILGRAWACKKGLYRFISACAVFIILIGQILDRMFILYDNCTHNDVWTLMRGMLLLTDS